MVEIIECLSPEAWAAIIAAFAAVWAIISQKNELKNTRFLKGIELLNSYSDRFSSPQFRERRKVSAKFLLKPKPDYENPPEDLVELLDFFESVGYLNRKKLLDAEAIWHAFSAWMLPYYNASRPTIMHMQRDDKETFSDLDKIFTKVKEFEEKKHPTGSALHILSLEAVKGLLRGEAGY